MKYLYDYDADKIRKNALDNYNHYLDRINALKALIENVNKLFYKNGNSKLKPALEILGNTPYYVVRQHDSLVLYKGSYSILYIGQDWRNKDELIKVADELLTDFLKKHADSAIKLNTIEQRIDELDELAATIITECKKHNMSAVERDIILDFIKYKI